MRPVRHPPGEAFASASLNPSFVYETVEPNRIGRRGELWVDPSAQQPMRWPASAARRSSRGADAEPVPAPPVNAQEARDLLLRLNACVSSSRRLSTFAAWAQTAAACLAATVWCGCRTLRASPFTLPWATWMVDVQVQQLLLEMPGMQELLQRAAHMVFAIQNTFGQATVRVSVGGRYGIPAVRHQLTCSQVLSISAQVGRP